jgi:hypothetical protein
MQSKNNVALVLCGDGSQGAGGTGRCWDRKFIKLNKNLVDNLSSPKGMPLADVRNWMYIYNEG